MATEIQGQSLISCQVCQKILAAFSAPFEELYHAELGVVSDILANACTHNELIVSHRTLWPVAEDYQNQKLTIYKDKNETAASIRIYYERPGFQGVRPGDSLGLVSRNGNQGRVRLIDTEWINIETIKDWRRRCLVEHGTNCNNHRLPMVEPAQPLWLIDVERGCLVSGNSGQDARVYIALSYTWGFAKSYKTTKENFSKLQQPGALHATEIRCQIPRTIEDAIGVVKSIGEKYLWVDSLCIVQDDPEMLGQELGRMHLIYANAYLTILAEAGTDAEYGLRGVKGVSASRTINQTLYELDGGEFLTSQNERWEPSVHITTGYRTRAWTFQEYIFAKRRLVFGEGRLSWQCNSAAWFEDILPYPLADAHFSKQDTWGQYKWMSMEVPSLQALSELVGVFNRKKLSFPEDISKAFAGFQSYLEVLYEEGFVFGLSEFFFDLALLWLGNADSKRRHPSDAFKGDPYQDNLPSWSWMGWTGDVKFPTDCEFETVFSGQDGIGFTAPTTQWYTLESPTATPGRLITAQWHKCRTRSADEEIPRGWIRKEYELGPPMVRGFGYRPKDYQPYLYKYGTDTDLCVYWYTLPAISPQPARMSTLQTQYLYCETTRVFLHATLDRLVDMRDNARLHVLHDEHGSIAGGLYPDATSKAYVDKQNARLSSLAPTTTTDESRIELVAVAKGWTVLFKVCFINESQGWMSQPDWPIPDADGNDDEDTRSWKKERASKDDCVFVLWIKWENGVAYRLGTGVVLAEAWERLKEEVKLVLG